jgi:hypothetical protein
MVFTEIHFGTGREHGTPFWRNQLPHRSVVSPSYDGVVDGVRCYPSVYPAVGRKSIFNIVTIAAAIRF